MNSPQHPKTVMLCSNGMVIVFNEKGEQMPALQGRYEKAAAALSVFALEDCEFVRSNWVKRSHAMMTREEFFSGVGHSE